MSLSNATETALLSYIFDDTNPSWHGASDFYVALYTADPGEAGTAPTNEIAYTSYARVAISRTTGFTVSGNTAENAALIQFPTCTGGSGTATHFGIVTSSSGAGTLICSGALSSSLAISSGIQPQFNAGDLNVVAD